MATIAITAALLFVPTLASAQVRVEVEPEIASIDPAAVAAGLRSELVELEVRVEGEAPARLIVRGLSAARVTIAFERDDGTRREREVDLPSDAAEATRIVVLVASNLARDQTEGLFPPDPAPVAPAEPAPSVADELAPPTMPARSELAEPEPDPRSWPERRGAARADDAQPLLEQLDARE